LAESPKAFPVETINSIRRLSQATNTAPIPLQTSDNTETAL